MPGHNPLATPNRPQTQNQRTSPPSRTGRSTCAVANGSWSFAPADATPRSNSLLADGASLAEIGRQLELERGTVRRFARATSVDELLVKAVNRASLLDGYTQHMTARLDAGITNATVLHHRTCRPRIHRQYPDHPPLAASSLPGSRPSPHLAAAGPADGPETPAHHPLDHDRPAAPDSRAAMPSSPTPS